MENYPRDYPYYEPHYYYIPITSWARAESDLEEVYDTVIDSTAYEISFLRDRERDRERMMPYLLEAGMYAEKKAVISWWMANKVIELQLMVLAAGLPQGTKPPWLPPKAQGVKDRGYE